MGSRSRKLVLAILLAAGVPAAQAQLSDMLRSLSGALRGGTGTAAPTQQGLTPTIGIRGIDEGGTLADTAAGEDNLLLDGWTATRSEAIRRASEKGLTARPVTFRSATVPETGEGPR